MELAEYERIVPNAQAPDLDGIPLTFILPNTQCAWRVQTLYTKETDTINWLRNMQTGEVLFDVGSNVGQYSMLAARKGVKVHAFEPEAQNFALLVRNIDINKLSDKCIAWPCALSDHMSLDILHLSSIMAGGSCHAFGKSINFKGEEHSFPHQQGSVATTMDHFAAKYGYPTHIKIDVDGFEHLVVKGGTECVKRAKSVLIEINTNYQEHMDLVSYMTNEMGYNYDSAQAEESRRKEGPFTGVGNVIFYRD